MRTDDQRRSDNFEDRGNRTGGGGGGGGGSLPIDLIFGLMRVLGWKGTLVVVAVLGVGWFLAPASLKHSLGGASGGTSSGSVASTCATHARECDFARAVLGSTEDVWREQMSARKVPGTAVAYRDPTLVVFTDTVATGGCGNARSSSGPFYCPADQKLYLDPTFYDVMARELHAPGDFAQAYVIAHEVGHHVQNLIGNSNRQVRGETRNQSSVRLELQADCLAGVWGHSARSKLSITDADLRQALNAAHNIGDDALGNTRSSDYTHGSSDQRMRWFRRGFDSGDARQCDTYSVAYAQL